MDWLYVSRDGFLNSNLFFALVTLLVGLIAYMLYVKGKADQIQEAATVVYSELKAVATKVRTIKEDFDRDGFLVESRYLLRLSSWSKYKYALLPELKLEDWSALDSFFADVEKYDKAVEINDSYFDSNAREIWVNIQKHYRKVLEQQEIPDDVSEFTNSLPQLPHSVSSKVKYFTDLYINNVNPFASYLPRRPINMARDALNNIDTNILISTAGSRMLKLSDKPEFYRMLLHIRKKRL